MSFRSEAAALLETAHGSVPVKSDQNLVNNPPSDAPWVRATFQDGAEGDPVSFGGVGGNLHRQPLVIIIDHFVPTNQGDGQASAMQEVSKAALRHQVIDGARWVRFDAGAEGEAEGEYRKQLIVIFRRGLRV